MFDDLYGLGKYQSKCEKDMTIVRGDVKKAIRGCKNSRWGMVVVNDYKTVVDLWLLTPCFRWHILVFPPLLLSDDLRLGMNHTLS